MGTALQPISPGNPRPSAETNPFFVNVNRTHTGLSVLIKPGFFIVRRAAAWRQYIKIGSPRVSCAAPDVHHIPQQANNLGRVPSLTDQWCSASSDRFDISRLRVLLYLSKSP